MSDEDGRPVNRETLWVDLQRGLSFLCAEAHRNSCAKGFWGHEAKELGPTYATGNAGEKIALMHSELSELLEVNRRPAAGLSPHGLPITWEAEELADLIIRAADYAGWRGIDLGQAVRVKHEFNCTRGYKHGKEF